LFTTAPAAARRAAMSRLYEQAARALAPSLSPSAASPSAPRSLRSRTMAADVDNKRAVAKLCYETLRRRSALDETLRRARVRLDDLASNPALAYVLVFELLAGAGEIRGGGAARRAVLAVERELRDAFASLPPEEPATDGPAARADGEVGGALPRYFRVNSLAEPDSDARAALARGLGAEPDAVVPDLWRLPASARSSLHAAHALVQEGRVVLQDKSSCFPAHALALEIRARGLTDGCDVVDATAAPGNKTTQLAASVSPWGGRVFAFDRSRERLDVLRRRVREARAERVVRAELRDFLAVDPREPALARVRAVLLDPTCSGSGLVAAQAERRLERGGDGEGAAADRVARLADFQLRALRHALSFPQAELVSYSTCSVHVAENEAVVHAALEAREGRAWRLVRALPAWTARRGVAEGGLTPAQAEMVVRAAAGGGEGDDTNGFFVAVFARVGASATEESRPRKRARAEAAQAQAPNAGSKQEAAAELRRKRNAAAWAAIKARAR